MAFPNSRRLLASITAAHRWLFRASGGRLGSRAGALHFLLLHHVGRKSGQRFATPLLYTPDAGRWLVVASNAGDDRHPAWWRNLCAQPEAEIESDGERVAVRARRSPRAPASSSCGPSAHDAAGLRLMSRKW